MYDRIRICLCHPKLIGLYYKDSFLRVIFYIVSLFAVFTGVAAAVAYNTDHFKYEDTKYVSNLILGEDKTSDIVLDKTNNRLTGTPVKYETGDLIVNFLVEESYSLSQKIIFRFKSDSVDVLYNGYIMGSYTYESMPVNGFSLEKMKTGDTLNIVYFQDCIDVLFGRVNTAYASFYFGEAVSVGIMYFFMILIVAFATSYFLNPTITGKIRFKLAIYSVSVFYLVMTLSLMLNAAWLQYVAIILPLVYSNITFAHIIKVGK